MKTKKKKKIVSWFLILTVLLGFNAGIQTSFAAGTAVISTESKLSTAQNYHCVVLKLENAVFNNPLTLIYDFGTTGLTEDSISYKKILNQARTEAIIFFSEKPKAGTIKIKVPAYALSGGEFGDSNTLSINVIEPTKEGEFWFYNGDVLGYDGESSDVLIPDVINGQTVTGIGQRVFDEKYINKVRIPSTVTTIGEFAFQSCSFKSVELPEGLQRVGALAFNASGLESLDIPSHITNIEYGAFRNIRVKHLTIPSTVKSIGQEAFEACFNLQHVSLPDGLEKIESTAFTGCTMLSSIVVPESVSVIGQNAFANCSRLSSAFFLGNAPTPNIHVFNGSAQGFKIYYLQGKTGFEGAVSETYNPQETHQLVYNGNTGEGPVPGLQESKIATTVSVADPGESLSKAGYEFIGWNTAADGSGKAYAAGDLYTMGLTNETLYAQWAKSYTINMDTSLKNGKITPHLNDKMVLTSIEGQRVFIDIAPDAGYRLNEKSLKITKEGTSETVRLMREGEFQYRFTMPSSNVVISASFEATASDYSGWMINDIWSLTGYHGAGGDIIVPSLIGGIQAKNINNWAFSDSLTLTGVTLNEGYETLKFGAFGYDGLLKSVNLPNSLISIENSVFSYCNSLESIIIPEKVSTMGLGIFNQCSKLNKVIFEGNAPVLKNMSFQPDGPPMPPNAVKPNAGLIQPHDKDDEPPFAGNSSEFKIYRRADATGYDQAPWTDYPQMAYKYLVRYKDNTAIRGSVPSEEVVLNTTSDSAIKIKGNIGNLVKTGYTFAGWNTKADGTGKNYAADETLITTEMTADLILYAKWTNNVPPTPTPVPNPTPVPSPTPTPTPTPTPAPTDGTKDKKETLSTEAKLDKAGKATAGVTEKQITEAIASAEKSELAKTLTIKIEASADAKIIETAVPKDALRAMAESKVEELLISTPIASLSFDSKSLDTIAANLEGDVKFSASKVELSTLSEDIKKSIGNKPVYNFSVTSGSKTLSEFGGHVTVALPYTPSAGEDLNAIVIYYINAQGELEMMSNCHYDSATGRVSFKTNHFSMFAIAYNKVSFTDVQSDAWYKTAVAFVGARKIATGTGEGQFNPTHLMTRGEFIVMIMKAYGIKAENAGADNFVDAGKTYYTGYLAAAKKLGITEGMGNNKFYPNTHISRQEMFTILYKTLKIVNALPKVTKEASLSAYSDVDQMAPWAKEAMTYFENAGIISGNNGKLNPKGNTSRAEMAAVIFKLLSK